MTVEAPVRVSKLAEVPADAIVMSARVVQSCDEPASKMRDTKVPDDAYGVIRIQSTTRVRRLKSLTSDEHRLGGDERIVVTSAPSTKKSKPVAVQSIR